MTIDRIFIRQAAENGAEDGGKGSGNWGHKGRPGQVGGSGKGGPSGSGQSGREYYAKAQEKYQFSKSPIASSGVKRFGYKGRRMSVLPKGSGTFKIDAGDIDKDDNRSSITPYLDKDGNVAPERQALHDRAIRKLFTNKPKMIPKEGEQPTYYFLGGGSASGKGGLTDPKTCQFYDMPSNEEMPTIDSDKFKEILPEYMTQNKVDDRAAGFAHEESSSLAKRANDAAFQNGYNCIMDGTGDGSVEKVLKKIEDARARGYKVEARYVTAPMDQALQRAIARGKKENRVIAPSVIKDIHRSVSAIFPQVASKFDHVVLYDTNQGKDENGNWKPGKKIAECWYGQPITVYDKDLYQAFLDKANYKD